MFFSEPGGTQELALAEHVADGGPAKPLFGFLAGRFVDDMPGTRFGHAGAMVQRGGMSAADKAALLRNSGVVLLERLGDLPRLLREAGVAGGALPTEVA